MSRKHFTAPERAVISELLALIQVLAEGDPAKTKPLGVLLFARLQAIFGGAALHTYSDQDILALLRALAAKDEAIQ